MSSAPDDRSLAGRLEAARRKNFVGRASLIELFGDAIAQSPPPMALLWIEGPGGIGKTSLLHQFAAVAARAGRAIARIDGRHLVASPAALIAAIGGQVGAADPSRWRDLSPGVLFLDTAEALGSVEGFLRDSVLPALPSSWLTVVASRHSPEPAWRGDPGWGDLLRVVALRDLSPAESRELLSARGVSAALHDRILDAAHGHPLALTLVADLAARGGEVAEPLRSSPDLLSVLLERFAHGAPDEAHRTALLLTAHVRATDEGLLRRVVDAERAPALMDWLRNLSFAETSAEGVHLHALAAEVIDADLRWRDPGRYRALHKEIRRTILERTLAAPAGERARLIRDLFWMHRQSPVIGPLVSWEASRTVYATPPMPADRAPILAAVDRFEGRAAADAIAGWLDRQPETFHVMRRSEADPIGFVLDQKFAQLSESERALDPLVAACWDEARRRGLRAGESIALHRWLAFDTHMAPGAHIAIVAAVEIDSWLTTPHLAFSFLAAPTEAARPWQDLFDYLDHGPGPTVMVGDVSFRAVVHDWRITPLDAFFELVGERELDGLRGAAPPPPRHVLVLSREEFDRAVRDALRCLGRPAELERSPLVSCRLVLDRRADAPADGLRAAVNEAASALARDPRQRKQYAALDRTYLRPAGTQEAAAELLGVPFSSYRRHLKTAIDAVCEALWQRELHGW